MRSKLFSASRHYGIAAALVLFAIGATLLLKDSASAAGFIFFYVAVIAASWLGGRWAGALTVLLSTAAVDYFFLPPVHSFGLRHQSIPVFLEFACSSAAIGWFSSWRRKAEEALTRAHAEVQRRVEERTVELRESNEQLRAEIAERRRVEAAFYEAQTELARVTRVSALGVLAASISHEVNQPVAAMVANADSCSMWLSADPPDLDEARAAAEAIAREGTRASDLIRRIRAMLTKAAPERSVVQLNDVIRDAIALIRTALAKGDVALRTELADPLPTTLADPVQLQQVIVNLALNGIEAMRGVVDRPHLLIIRSEFKCPDELMVAVTDSGAGIRPEDLKRIFDPFFTTKNQGMGMGLSISHSIIAAHDGRLWASGNDDYGATFRFTLPRICSEKTRLEE